MLDKNDSNPFSDFAKESLERLKKQRNIQAQARVLTPDVSLKPEDTKPDSLQHLSPLMDCCPESKNHQSIPQDSREKEIMLDFIEKMIDAYPEEVRSQIRDKVMASFK